jgi:NAD(P)-dependent dehydrogenase (short-subunit alcohol dehydrogenase family)
MKEFANKLAVVTGAATGMGRELALQLSAEGCDVALCDVDMEVLEQTAAGCRNNGVAASAHHCDVSDETQVLAFQEQVSAAHNTTTFICYSTMLASVVVAVSSKTDERIGSVVLASVGLAFTIARGRFCPC